MAFKSYADLIQATIVRLRQTPGAGVQLYSEAVIGSLIQETYEYVRSRVFWDHLTKWLTRELDGTTGKVTEVFLGAREGWDDIDRIVVGNSNRALPQLSHDINPHRLTGTTPRFVEPLHYDDDVYQYNSGIRQIFRVWPLTAVASGSTALRVRIRTDPFNLFTDPTVMVPFDDTILINGAAAKYAADDGANPATVQMLTNAYQTRLDQKIKQHNDAIVVKDPRLDYYTSNEWIEEP